MSLLSAKPTISDPDWINYHDVSYKFVLQTAMTPGDARAHCDETGVERLAEVMSENSNDLLLYLAKKEAFDLSLTVSEVLLGKLR